MVEKIKLCISFPHFYGHSPQISTLGTRELHRNKVRTYVPIDQVSDRDGSDIMGIEWWCENCSQSVLYHRRFTRFQETIFFNVISAYRLKQSFNFKMHWKTHTGDKPCSCTFCDKRFRSSSNITSHSRTYSGERPYIPANYVAWDLRLENSFTCSLQWYITFV